MDVKIKLLKRKFDQICTFSFLSRRINLSRNKKEIRTISQYQVAGKTYVFSWYHRRKNRGRREIVGSSIRVQRQPLLVPLLHNTHRRGIVVTFGDTSPLTFATCCERSNARARSTKRPNPRSIAYPLNSQPCASIPDFA